jgi:glycosyltransferase involved in cell wall biosynthesis
MTARQSTLVTVAIPSFNQAVFLDEALRSIFSQDLPVEVFVADGGSTDGSVDIIRKWEQKLAWWRSCPDKGQSAAVNEAIGRGSAPYVCWLNADDFFLPEGLVRLWRALDAAPQHCMIFARASQCGAKGEKKGDYLTCAFSPYLFANRCTISQPATLIRRSAWDSVNGLDETLDLAMDYDLWWKLYYRFGQPLYLRVNVACARLHAYTKTSTRRLEQHRESMSVLERHCGRVPLKWYLAWPYSVALRTLLNRLERNYGS